MLSVVDLSVFSYYTFLWGGINNWLLFNLNYKRNERQQFLINVSANR